MPSDFTEFPISRLNRLVQPLNASSSIVLTESGIIIEIKFVQLQKANASISSRFNGSCNVISFSHLKKACPLIILILGDKLKSIFAPGHWIN